MIHVLFLTALTKGVNDSEESSFRFYGKEQGSDTSYQPNYLPNYVVPVKKSAKVMKDKLRINMMDLQLIQAKYWIAFNTLVNAVSYRNSWNNTG